MPSLGNLSDSGIEPVSLMSPVLAGRFFITRATLEAPYKYIGTHIGVDTYQIRSDQLLSRVRLFATP